MNRTHLDDIWTWAVDKSGYDKKKFLALEKQMLESDHTEKIRERIAFWETQYCNTAALGGTLSGCVCILVDLSTLIGETWTPEGIFERERARKILADMRKNITV
jgi:hypothetical protein